MLKEAFNITFFSVGQIFILGALGFFLVKRNILGKEGLHSLSRLVIEVTLPILIFMQLIRDFRFDLYPRWWIFPLLSIGITFFGFFCAFLFLWIFHKREEKIQFLNLIAFQNSGYLPLVLAATLLPEEQAKVMFIYLFLFLLGFNLLVWSLGVYSLTKHTARRFELGAFFSPPVIAALGGLFCVSLGIDKFIPTILSKPLLVLGDCTLPLAILVVGGNLAELSLRSIQVKAITAVILLKLILMPALGLIFILKFRLFGLLGLLIIMQLAMPPATSLSVIMRHYRKEDLLIGEGIFWAHLASIFTLPIILSLYFYFAKVYA